MISGQETAIISQLDAAPNPHFGRESVLLLDITVRKCGMKSPCFNLILASSVTPWHTIARVISTFAQRSSRFARRDSLFVLPTIEPAPDGRACSRDDLPGSCDSRFGWLKLCRPPTPSPNQRSSNDAARSLPDSQKQARIATRLQQTPCGAKPSLSQCLDTPRHHTGKSPADSGNPQRRRRLGIPRDSRNTEQIKRALFDTPNDCTEVLSNESHSLVNYSCHQAG